MAAQMRLLDPASSPWHRFGAEVRELRIACGWSQTELGSRVAASKSLISKIETADRRAQPDLACRLDIAFGVHGELIRHFPAEATDEGNIRPGAVMVVYEGPAGAVRLSTDDPEVIEFCDSRLARSLDCATAWTIEARSHAATCLPSGVPSEFANIQVDSLRAVSRIGAASGGALKLAAWALRGGCVGRTCPPLRELRSSRRHPAASSSQ